MSSCIRLYLCPAFTLASDLLSVGRVHVCRHAFGYIYVLPTYAFCTALSVFLFFFVSYRFCLALDLCLLCTCSLGCFPGQQTTCRRIGARLWCRVWYYGLRPDGFMLITHETKHTGYTHKYIYTHTFTLDSSLALTIRAQRQTYGWWYTLCPMACGGFFV